MRIPSLTRLSAALLFAIFLSIPSAFAAEPFNYADLAKLFEQWRAFAQPTRINSATGSIPDYSPTAMAAKTAALPEWRKRLEAIDSKGWSIEQANDLKLIRAEMNGLDFDLRVLQPWARDPAFYLLIWPARTDVPLREGPLADPEIALYNYHWPLSPADQSELTAKIGAVPALLAEAKENLKASNARDLWVYGAGELRR